MPQPLIQFRPYQDEAFSQTLGILALVWARQRGKSYLLANIALDWMMAEVCDVIFASAAIRLGQENIRKEADVWRDVTQKLRAAAAAQGALLTTNADDDKGNLIDADAVADLFEHQKLETKIWHNRTQFSRSLVVAPNPDTAVGWTGNVIMDEVGRIPDFRDVFEAMEPIVSANPNFKMRLATTPPPDDAHYSYELLAPPAGSEFKTSPRGNYYTTDAGITVHRVDAADGYAAGVPLYDLKSRKALSPDEHRALAVDRQAWDRNYGLAFLEGGVTALSRMALLHAQGFGADQGLAIYITDSLEAA